MRISWTTLWILFGFLGLGIGFAEEKPVPAFQAVPLPHHQVSFRRDGRELTRFHYGPADRRPFWYPVRTGRLDRSATRMGHPHDPHSHSHHNSVWISHHVVNGIDFWGDHGKDAGRIVLRKVDKLIDADDHCGMEATLEWQGPDGAVVMLERRTFYVRAIEATTDWWLEIRCRFEAPGDKPVVFEKNPFGVIGVRMEKSIGVHDGGGRILNSEGAVNEKPIFRKPAKWVDYSGRLTNAARAGITLMDHPSNPNHPAPFHVRNDGWMGACLTLDSPLEVAPGKPLELIYGLLVHDGVPKRDLLDARWNTLMATDGR